MVKGLIVKIRVACRVGAFVVATVVCWACLILESLLRRRSQPSDLVYKWASRWARTQLRIFGVRVRVGNVCADNLPERKQSGLYPGHCDRQVGRIFVCNHRSSVDIALLLSLIEAHLVSRHDLADWPVVGRGAKQVGTLFVDRTSRRSGANVQKEVRRTLAAGEGVVMFPEGSSFIGDEVRPFRPGAFKAAQRAGAEIVPIGVAYNRDKASYYHEPFLTHALRVAAFRSLDAAVFFGEPMSINGRTPVEMREAVREKMQELVDGARALLNKHVPESDA